ncbi:MAG: hypothetical protein IKK66_09670 [Ruminococcus sp.]|nr:hypothetical protein [Ruminococcus sp.]
MNKYKQNLYTILLILTCFVASPFIFHKIWKTSSEAKKTVNVPPPSVSDAINNSNESSGDSSVVDSSVSDGTVDVSQVQNPTQAPDAVYTFGASDISYFDDALFIGDSRTVGIQEYGTFTNSDFFCSIGMMASNIDSQNINGQTFDQLIDAKQYGKVYVMLGINEVGNDFQFTLTKYRAIIEKLKAHQTNATIYIQANLHVSAAAETNIINNENIDYLNSLFAELADNKKVFYIDINELYDDESGNLTASYTSDGIHPLAAYYKQWCEWLSNKTVITNTPTEQPATENAVPIQ